MKRAMAYMRNDGWYFQAMSKTTVGVGLGTPPRIKIDVSASSEAIGAAVLEALHGSREGIPQPPPKEADRLFKPMLDLAGVKSWAAFAQDARLVIFSVNDEWLTFDPWKKAGAKKGFVSISGVSLRIPADSPVDRIGETLIESIALCTP